MTEAPVAGLPAFPVHGDCELVRIRVRGKRETRRLALPPCRPRAGCAQLLGRRISDGVRRAFRAADVRENPHRQPRRDRLPRHPHRAPARHRAPWPCIPRPTPTRNTCGRPTRPIRSAVRGRRIRYLRGDAIIEVARRIRRPGDPPGLRLSQRERGFRRRGRGGRAGLHRPGRPHRCGRWAARPAPRN